MIDLDVGRTILKWLDRLFKIGISSNQLIQCLIMGFPNNKMILYITLRQNAVCPVKHYFHEGSRSQ
jgi:hypothetical protein